MISEISANTKVDNLSSDSPNSTAASNKMKVQSSSLNYDGPNRKFCPVDKYPNEQPPDRVNTSSRLQALRREMKRTTALHGYIVTSDDEHQSEFVATRDERRKYISGFSGSAGEVLVTEDKAVLWTDGRYFLQADSQLDCNWILMRQRLPNTPTLTQWLQKEFKDKEARIGADPKLIPAFVWDEWENELTNTNIKLIPIESNLIDIVWQNDRPEYNTLPAFPLNISYAGKSWQEKVKQVRDELSFRNVSALIVTALDEIAWLFNIRGYDLPNTNVLRAYAIIEFEKIRLYTPKHKLDQETRAHLKMDGSEAPDCVTWVDYSEIFNDLKKFSEEWKLVWLPSRYVFSPGASKLVHSYIPAEKRLIRPSPIIDLKAEKNKVEIAGMKNAHLKDAVAMCDCFAYLEERMEFGTEELSELQIVKIVNSFRFEQKDNVEISFDTIVGYGPHGALPHYEPTTSTSIKIGRDSTLVIDSGGQYRDGTTDLTRTFHFGVPEKKHREAYTEVLIGQIELATTIFPKNLRSDQLDVVARRALWSTGKDYNHGTSHGVGHFLCVHESPIYLAFMGLKHQLTPGCVNALLKPGYFLSNEPGYYKEDDFGIRLENVLEVIPANVSPSGGQEFYKFHDVALVPYEPKLIEVEMLSPAHRCWLNKYNKRIRDEVGTELKKQLRLKGYSWMMKKTRSIPEYGPVDLDYYRGISNFDTRKTIVCWLMGMFIIIIHRAYAQA